MKCPDCGQNLVETPVTNIDKSFRCENCGGFWVEGWVVNRVAEGQMREFPEVKPDVSKFTGKTDKCPVDHNPLFGDSSDQIPPEVVAVKCSHCGWWWFGGDNLMKFKKAHEAKASYLKWWKGKKEVTMLALPAVLMLVMVVGLVGGVVSISRRQEAGVTASVVNEYQAKYLGNGVEQIRFRTDKEIGFVSLRKLSEEVWGPVEVANLGDGWYEARITGLEESEIYQMQILGKRYYFNTK